MLTHSLPQTTTDKQTDKATSHDQMVHETDLSWMKSTNMIFSMLTIHMGPPINMSGRQLDVVREWNGRWHYWAGNLSVARIFLLHLCYWQHIL